MIVWAFRTVLVNSAIALKSLTILRLSYSCTCINFNNYTYDTKRVLDDKSCKQINGCPLLAS